MSRYLIMALFFGFCCVTGISGADGDYALDVPTVQAKDSKSESKKSSDSKSRDKSSRDSASKDNRSSDSKSSDDKKVTLCHAPPGNPDNARSISVVESAVSAHLAHGDTLGECAAPASCVCPPGVNSCICPDGTPGDPGSAASTPGPGSQRGVHGQ